MRTNSVLIFLVLGSLITPAGVVHAEDVPDASPAGDYARPLELPRIVRFRDLPQRWFLEPAFELGDPRSVADRTYVPFLTRMIREAESEEIQQRAAEYLAGLAREGREDITPAVNDLRRLLGDTGSHRVRHACVMALVEAEDRASAEVLLALLGTADESTRLLIEPFLAECELGDAVPIWMARLDDPFTTVSGYRQAAAGLAATNHQPAIDPLSDAAVDSTRPFSRRMAAARAVLRLDPERSQELAETLLNGSVTDRLLSVSLMAEESAVQKDALVRLCQDENGTVAVAAWRVLQRIQPETLLPLLEGGRKHRESGIRMFAATVMQQYPTAERCDWLLELCGDIHIEVRNNARSCLVVVATQDTDLQNRIVTGAETIAADSSRSWEQLEQSLVLLSQLRQPQVAPLSVPLLQHVRGEVCVTAAWTMHLFPQPELLDDCVRETRERNQLLEQYASVNPQQAFDDLGLQVGYLFQMASLLRDRQLEDLMEAQFSKSAPGGIPKRAAAMWSLGLLNEGDSDSPLIARYEQRIKDTEGPDPEEDEVRQTSVIALGRLQAVSANPTLLGAFANGLLETLIPQSVRWSMQLMDQRVPKLPEPSANVLPGFPL